MKKVIGRKKLSPLFKNFALVLADQDRFGLLPGMFTAFNDLLDERRGVVKAQVSTPFPLTDETRAFLAAELKAATGKEVTLVERAEPALIGGLRIQIGDKVWDNSVRANLDNLKQRVGASSRAANASE